MSTYTAGCASKVSFVLAATGKTGHSGFPKQVTIAF